MVLKSFNFEKFFLSCVVMIQMTCLERWVVSIIQKDGGFFIDLSKVSLQAVRLHDGSIHPPVPIAYCVHLKGSHASMRTVLICIDCDNYRRKLCGDLIVLGLLLGMQQC